MQQWFHMLCIWIDVESDGELYTLPELHTRMTELAAGEEVYGMKRLKQKLIDKYKDSIFFAEIDGRSNVVCFRNMVNYILNDAWYDARKKNKEKDAERIIATAAKLISGKRSTIHHIIQIEMTYSIRMKNSYQRV